jgi:multicomponent Na+:H+ antiporter subunit D
LSRVGGLVRSAPMIAVLFALPALSIAGIPPFSGFVAKFALVSAGIEAQQWGIVVVSLTVSLLTMYVMGRIWSNVFWGQPEDGEIAERLESGATKLPILMTASTVVVVGFSVALLVFAGPLYDLAERAAADLLNPQGYIDAVLGSHSEAGG